MLVNKQTKQQGNKKQQINLILDGIFFSFYFSFFCHIRCLRHTYLAWRKFWKGGYYFGDKPIQSCLVVCHLKSTQSHFTCKWSSFWLILWVKIIRLLKFIYVEGKRKKDLHFFGKLKSDFILTPFTQMHRTREINLAFWSKKKCQGHQIAKHHVWAIITSQIILQFSVKFDLNDLQSVILQKLARFSLDNGSVVECSKHLNLGNSSYPLGAKRVGR